MVQGKNPDPLLEAVGAVRPVLHQLDDRGVFIGGIAAFGEVLENPQLWDTIAPLLRSF